MEEKKKEDRRITRTRQALHQALTELVQEKGYDAVTIEDITTRANLGRTTFYLHYQDKEEILLEGLEENLLEVVELITKRPLIFWFRVHKGSLIKLIFEKVKENAGTFTLITKAQSNKVYDRFRSIIGRVAQKLINENPVAQTKVKELSVPVDYLIDYFSGAMWASIVWWVGQDFAQSIDQMTDSFRKLFFPGLLRVLKVKKFSELAETLTS
ncbi:MAG: TetR/AcrR family transcriptional regulator [Anaerolineaceae bacterium]